MQTSITSRRAFVAGAAATLATPRLARAQAARTLKFVPYADLTTLDPIVSGNYAVRNHAMLVFDTLYGVDAAGVAQPQMAAGHAVEDDGRRWTITLRPGLRFHDGSPVLARDAVASLQRWGKRDALGAALFAATDELSAPDDRTVVFRLKRPFPLLPYALGKPGSNIAVIMPARLAATEPSRPVAEMVGSGPYRYAADERLEGARNVYHRFADYVPRLDATASLMAGGKVAWFDRVEWHTIPDPATAVGALQTGQVDWVEQPSADFWPKLRQLPTIRTEVLDPDGTYNLLRFNFLQPPFNDGRIRRAACAALSQSDAMLAIIGDERAMWDNNVGFFTPGSPMANDVGLDRIKDPPDLALARRLLGESGYRGERVVVLDQSTSPTSSPVSNVVAAAWKSVGFNVDIQAVDLAALLQRLGNKGPVEERGWSAVPDFLSGTATLNPMTNNYLRATGASALSGWPTIPALEALRADYLRAKDDAERKEICQRVQQVCFDELPYVPMGVFRRLTAYSRSLDGVLKGMPLFYGVRRA